MSKMSELDYALQQIREIVGDKQFGLVDSNARKRIERIEQELDKHPYGDEADDLENLRAHKRIDALVERIESLEKRANRAVYMHVDPIPSELKGTVHFGKGYTFGPPYADEDVPKIYGKDLFEPQDPEPSEK